MWRLCIIFSLLLESCSHVSLVSSVHLTEEDPILISGASEVALMVKNPHANAGDTGNAGSIPGSGRSPGEGHGSPLQYSWVEASMDRGTWCATVHGVAKSQTWLNWFSMHTDWFLHCHVSFFSYIFAYPPSLQSYPPPPPWNAIFISTQSTELNLDG